MHTHVLSPFLPVIAYLILQLSQIFALPHGIHTERMAGLPPLTFANDSLAQSVKSCIKGAWLTWHGIA